jgi:hypothetical protein
VLTGFWRGNHRIGTKPRDRALPMSNVSKETKYESLKSRSQLHAAN